MKKAIGILLTLAFTVTGLCIFAEAAMGCGIGVMAGEVTAVKSGGYGEKIRILPEDITRAACITDFESITVMCLPRESEGTLLLAGRRVKEGQTVKKRALSNLIFVPKSKEVAQASFSLSVNGAGAGEEICFHIRFCSGKNSSPTGGGEGTVAFTTQSDIPIYGRLSGIDPDGDKIEFITVVPPKNGAFIITDSGTGEFRYVPSVGFVGADEIKYVIRDEYGNFSEVICVGIRVDGRLSPIVLSDMEGRSEYGAAVAMCAVGVMGVTERGGLYYFSPNDRVTRAEFVMMAMKAFGMEPSDSESFFDDDGDIPLPMRGYVAVAAKNGIVNGDFVDGALVFRPNDTVTRVEAAVIIADILGISGGIEEEVFLSFPGVPVWAVGRVSAVLTLGLFDYRGGEFIGSEGLCRAEVAECLYALSKVK